MRQEKACNIQKILPDLYGESFSFLFTPVQLSNLFHVLIAWHGHISRCIIRFKPFSLVFHWYYTCPFLHSPLYCCCITHVYISFACNWFIYDIIFVVYLSLWQMVSRGRGTLCDLIVYL